MNAPHDRDAEGEANESGDSIAARDKPGPRAVSAVKKGAKPPGNYWLLLPVLLPIVGYLGAIGVAEARRAGAPRVEVKIEGYDPRDPVRGHYLQFRLTVESDVAPDPLTPWQIPYDQACLGPVKDGITSVIGFSGAMPKECSQTLPSDFVHESHRFYIQEDAAPVLEKAVMDKRGTAVLLLLKPEKALVHELKVDGRPWTEFAP